MSKRAAVGTALVSLAVFVSGSSLIASGSTPEQAGQTAVVGAHGAIHPRSQSSNATLKKEMRKLWEDHITWTRMFIVSSVADLPDAGAAAERLLLNQEHIGDAIKPFYGNKAGNALTALLKDHILIAADILTAAKEGDAESVEEARQRWDDNAVDIAVFLSKANPKNWPKAEMKAMMRDHLELTLTEATARLNADWDADIAAYDAIHDQALHMADMLSRGIIKQFAAH